MSTRWPAPAPTPDRPLSAPADPTADRPAGPPPDVPAGDAGPARTGGAGAGPLAPAPRPLRPWAALHVARVMARTHRRPPRLPWHASATGAVGFFSTIAGSAYSTPAGDAVAVVWRCTPAGLAAGASRIGAALAAPPALIGLATRSWVAAGAVAALEAGALVALDLVYEISSRRARARWLERPRNRAPEPGARIQLLRMGHLVGLGVGADTPHAADAMCRAIAQHADLPIYLVASTPAHVRLYRRFGFEKAGPSWYGETPMVRPPGPLDADR